MALKPGRQSKPARRRKADKRRHNKGVGLARLVQVRQQVVDKSLPNEKAYRSRSGATTWAKAQLAEHGARYQVLDVGTKRKPEFVAVKLDVPLDDVQRSREFKRLMHVLKTRRGKSANGPLARALVDLGLRDEDATWPVGES